MKLGWPGHLPSRSVWFIALLGRALHCRGYGRPVSHRDQDHTASNQQSHQGKYDTSLRPVGRLAVAPRSPPMLLTRARRVSIVAANRTCGKRFQPLAAVLSRDRTCRIAAKHDKAAHATADEWVQDERSNGQRQSESAEGEEDLFAQRSTLAQRPECDGKAEECSRQRESGRRDCGLVAARNEPSQLGVTSLGRLNSGDHLQGAHR